MKCVGVIVALMVWVVVGFFVAEFAVSFAAIGLEKIGIPLADVDSTTLEAALAAVIYIVTLVLVIGVPWWVFHRRTSRRELGLMRLMSWKDIALACGGVVIYLILSGTFSALAGHIPGFPSSQAQDVGFGHMVKQYEYALAFLTLVVVAPLAEETLFRGYLYGKIRKRAPFWVTLLLVSVVFASLHLPGVDSAGHFQWQWNVALDVFALSLVLASLREVTENIWAGVLVHMIKNGIAFYVLFIIPILSTLK